MYKRCVSTFGVDDRVNIWENWKHSAIGQKNPNKYIGKIILLKEDNFPHYIMTGYWHPI